MTTKQNEDIQQDIDEKVDIGEDNKSTESSEVGEYSSIEEDVVGVEEANEAPKSKKKGRPMSEKRIETEKKINEYNNLELEFNRVNEKCDTLLKKVEVLEEVNSKYKYNEEFNSILGQIKDLNLKANVEKKLKGKPIKQVVETLNMLNDISPRENNFTFLSGGESVDSVKAKKTTQYEKCTSIKDLIIADDVEIKI